MFKDEVRQLVIGDVFYIMHIGKNNTRYKVTHTITEIRKNVIVTFNHFDLEVNYITKESPEYWVHTNYVGKAPRNIINNIRKYLTTRTFRKGE